MARRKTGAQVPYDAINRAMERARVDHPDADDVRPVFSFGKVYAEVWKKGHAHVFLYDENPE